MGENKINKQEFKRLKNYVKKRLPNDYDKYDVEAKVDTSISFEENKSIIEEEITELYGERLDEIIKKEKGYQEQEDLMIIQEIKKTEDKAQKEFKESLDNLDIKSSKNIDKSFMVLNKYVKAVCSRAVNGLILEGDTGIGKSHNVLKAINESGIEFIYCSGYTTTLELYHFLYEHKDKVIFFDDTKNIFSSNAGLEILKSCLFSVNGKRLVRYSTTSNKLKVPNQFIFEGGLIVSVNDLGWKQDEDLKAVVDRVIYYNLKFDYFEKLKIIKELVNKDYKETTKKDREFIFDYIKNNTTKATENLNFRLFFKLLDIYLFDKDNFNILAKDLIRTNKEIDYLYQVLEKSNSIKEAQVSWTEETGKSRRTFYRLKKQMGAE